MPGQVHHQAQPVLAARRKPNHTRSQIRLVYSDLVYHAGRRILAETDVQSPIPSYRAILRARLAAGQSALLASLLRPGGHVDEQPAIAILEREAATDRRVAKRLLEALEDGEATVSIPDASPSSLFESVTRVVDARRELLDTLARLPDEDLCRVAADLEGRARDKHRPAAHLRELPVAESAGPIAPILLAALRASRKEMLTALALVPSAHRPTHVLPDGRSLQRALAQLAESDRALIITTEGTASKANTSGTWAETWRALHDTRQAVLNRIVAYPPGDHEDGGLADLLSAIIALVDADRQLSSLLHGEE